MMVTLWVQLSVATLDPVARNFRVVGICHSTNWWLGASNGKIGLIVIYIYIEHVLALWLFYCFFLQQALQQALDVLIKDEEYSYSFGDQTDRSNTQFSS